jgi:hypothetical protein
VWALLVSAWVQVIQCCPAHVTLDIGVLDTSQTCL